MQWGKIYINGVIQMIENYPDDADVYEIISSKMPFGNVRDFFKKRGMIYIVNKRTEVALYCSRLFLGFEDYEEMRSQTETKRNLKKISGVELKTPKELSEIATVLSSKKGDILDEKANLTLKEVVLQEDGTVKGVISYQSKNVGKVDLLRKEDRESKFEIEEREDRKIVLIHHDKNDDYVKILEAMDNISKDLSDEEGILPQILTLERLTIPQRIEFFDRLLAYEYDDWRLENVISIKIRKGEELEDEILERDLSGINEALLKGDNLRTNAVVQKFETSGYYFSGITIKLAHKREPIKISVEMLFKSKPELPEINITKSVEIIDDEEVKKILHGNEQNEYLKMFWGIFENIYFKFAE